MPEYLRALCFILFAAFVIFMFGKRVACPGFIPENAFNRRRNLWIGLTLSAFFAHNYWIFYIIAAVLIIYGSQREPNKFALYLFLMVALPNFPKTLMFSNVKIFEFDYLRLLGLTILLPSFVKLGRNSPQVQRFGNHLQDKVLLTFLLLNFALHFKVQTPPEQIRYAIYLLLGSFLPYYIASRTLNTMEDMRDALMSFAVACMVLAAIGFLEWSRHWLLYSALKRALSVNWGFIYYLGRGVFLRAVGTAGQPIALGYVMAVALGILLYFQKFMSSKIAWRIAFAVLSLGLLSSMSRGPWVGAAVMLIIFLVKSSKATANMVKLGAVALVVVSIAATTNVLDKYIEYLPFIGSVDNENVEFRERLMTESIGIIMRNPWFGDLKADLEQFRTGENVVDVVNSYVLIALKSGIIGLGLFVSFFCTICLGIYQRMRRCINKEDESYQLGRTLLSVLIGIQVIIVTVALITVIPYIFWSLAGVGVAYMRLMDKTSFCNDITA